MLKLAGPSSDAISRAIEEAGGLDKIEKLQQHKNEDIYKLSYAIIDKYFNSEVSSQTVSGWTSAQNGVQPQKISMFYAKINTQFFF